MSTAVFFCSPLEFFESQTVGSASDAAGGGVASAKTVRLCKSVAMTWPAADELVLRSETASWYWPGGSFDAHAVALTSIGAEALATRTTSCHSAPPLLPSLLLAPRPRTTAETESDGTVVASGRPL